MIRKWRATAEAAAGVFKTASPAFQHYLPMDTANSFKPLTSRPSWTIQDGSGQNVPRVRGSEVIAVGGQLQTRLYWESAAFFALLASRVNGAQTAPWATDQKPGDFASFTVDFAWSYDDLSYKYMRYLGCKVGQNFRLEMSNSPDNPHLNLTADIVGCKPIPNAYTADAAITATDLPDPTYNQIPVSPITFQQSAWTFLGGDMPYFDRFSIAFSNKVKPYYDKHRFPNRIHCSGRAVTLTAHMLLQVAADPRLKYEAVQALGACSILFTNPVIPAGKATADKLKLDFRSNSYLDQVGEEMILDEDAYTEISATAFLDGTSGDDFAISFTPAA